MRRVYTKKAIERLIADGAIEEYPPPRKSTWRHCPLTVTQVNEDYLHPDTKPVNGKALVDWLRARRHEETIWPADADMQDFEGEKHSIDWACHKTYHQQGGSTYRIRTGHYQFKCQASSFLEWLRNTPWLPTTKGPVRPSQAFPAKQGIREVLGDAVPYFEGNLSGNIQSLLGIRSDVTVEDLLALLKDISRSAGADQDLTERIYAQLHARTHYWAYDVSTRFANEALILVKDRQQQAQWRKSGECVWEDASGVLGDDFAYLSLQYPKLHDFFVDRLGVKERVDPECYAQRWLKLQQTPLPDIEQLRTLVERLYRGIKPIALQPETDRPVWWHDFAQKLKVYTQSNAFQSPNKVVLSDDGVYRDSFQGAVPFAWRPPKDRFNDWALFYRMLGTSLLSEVVTEHLDGDVAEAEPLSQNRFVTEAAIKMIAAWLSEKREEGYDYERFLKDGSFARLAAIREIRVSSDINLEFRLEVGTIKASSSESYPVFWNRSDGTLIYNSKVRKGEIAKAIAKGLLGNHRYKDFADWVELVLEAEDTQRLKNKDWSVPQPILDLIKERTPAPETPATPKLPPNAAPPPAREDAPPLSPNRFGSAAHAEEHPIKSSDVDAKTPRTSSSSSSAQSPESGQPQKHIQGKEKDDDTAGFSFLDELTKAFNREGVTRFDDDDWESNYAGGAVKDPVGRGEKLKQGYRDAIDNEPPPEARRRIAERSLLEGPDEAVRRDLYEWYHGKCQICGETWPERGGRPYFAAAYLVERRHARWVDTPGNAICLCAKHFVQWRLATVETPENVIDQIRSPRLAAEGGDGHLLIRFRMCGEDQTITYVERHLLALIELIKTVSDAGDDRV